MRAAVLSSIPSDLDGFVKALLEGDTLSQRSDLLSAVIRTAHGMQRLELAQSLMSRLDALPASTTHFNTLAETLRLNLTESQRSNLLQAVPQSITSAHASLNDPSKDRELRAASLSFLAAATTIPADTLNGLVQTDQPIELQEAAIRELAVTWPEPFAQRCLQSWITWEPAVREVAKDQIHRRADVADQLLKATTIPNELQRLLVQHPNAAVKERAINQLGTPEADPKLLEKFAQADPKAADKAHGQQVFAENCQICHHVHDQGNDVGPDLTALTNPSRDFLLQSIIHPNEAVEDKYLGYAIATHAGDTSLGLMESVSGGSISLRLANGSTQQIVRSDIATLTSTGVSLMPEGFGESLTVKDMNDLLGYLTSLRTPRKHFDKNEPALITADATTNTLRLKATQASVHGPSLTFGTRYLHLENWSHVQDQAVWTIRCDKPGRYAVALDFSCADKVAGDGFQFIVGDEKLLGHVPGTKNFNGFRQQTFGEIQLSEGEQECVFRSAGPINKYLIDLREVTLTYLD